MARDNLGVYGDWGVFRDAKTPRCYAIAMPAPSQLRRDFEPYATIGTWPKRGVRGQVHFRVSRKLAAGTSIRLRVGNKSFRLVGGGSGAWAKDKPMDAAIVAAIRAAGSMTIGARDDRGNRFSNTYSLDGAATAMDAATVGCAKLG